MRYGIALTALAASSLLVGCTPTYKATIPQSAGLPPIQVKMTAGFGHTLRTRQDGTVEAVPDPHWVDAQKDVILHSVDRAFDLGGKAVADRAIDGITSAAAQ